MRAFYWPSQPVSEGSKFPTAIIAAVRLPRDSIANVWALPLTFILSLFLSHSLSPLSLYLPPIFSHTMITVILTICKAQTYPQKQLSDINFPRARTRTSPRIHTSLHSIAIICSYGYIKKYVHQGGNLRYEMFSPFAKVRKLWAEYFTSPFSLPSMVVCTVRWLWV